MMSSNQRSSPLFNQLIKNEQLISSVINGNIAHSCTVRQPNNINVSTLFSKLEFK